MSGKPVCKYGADCPSIGFPDHAAVYTHPTKQRSIIAEDDDADVVERRLMEGALDEDVIADHLEKFLEAEDNKDSSVVVKELFGGIVVYVFAPSKILGRDHYTLVTMGMSGTKMNVPDSIEDAEKYAHAELMCYVPASWDPQDHWPVNMLKAVALYVVHTRAWVSELHGLPNMSGDAIKEGSNLSFHILLHPTLEREGFFPVDVHGTQVNLLLMIPLTAEEAQWKRDVGAENSIFYIVGNRRENADIPIDYVIDPDRKCAVEDLGLRKQMEVEELGG